MPKGVYKRSSLVFGVGINDANEKIGVGNKVYQTWTGMLARVGRHKNYLDCSICEDWKRFSKFKAWMEKQNYVGMCLDKDILKPGNKIYCPEYCVFVPQNINKLIGLKKGERELPIGVSDNKHPKGSIPFEYSAAVNNGKGRPVHIGYFATPTDAHKAWQWNKALQIELAVAEYAKHLHFNPIVAEALTSRVWKLRSQFSSNELTTYI